MELPLPSNCQWQLSPTFGQVHVIFWTIYLCQMDSNGIYEVCVCVWRVCVCLFVCFVCVLLFLCIDICIIIDIYIYIHCYMYTHFFIHACIIYV